MGSPTSTTPTAEDGGGSGSSFKRADVLDAMQALRVSDDLQDAVARGLAGTRLVPVHRLRAALREAGVPDRVALRVEDRLVSGWEVCCGVLVFSLVLFGHPLVFISGPCVLFVLLQEEAAEEETARKGAAEMEEAARKGAAEVEAALKRAAEIEEAARKRAADAEAAQEAARKRAAEEEAREAARKRAAEQEAARKLAAEQEALRKRAAEEAARLEEVARKRAADIEAAARQRAAQVEEAARRQAAEAEAARKRAVEEEAARRQAAEEEAAKRAAEGMRVRLCACGVALYSACWLAHTSSLRGPSMNTHTRLAGRARELSLFSSRGVCTCLSRASLSPLSCVFRRSSLFVCARGRRGRACFRALGGG